MATPGEGYRDILEFIGVQKSHVESIDDAVFSKRYKEYSHALPDEAHQMSNSTEEYLERFFKPYNDELADLLGEEWRGVWG